MTFCSNLPDILCLNYTTNDELACRFTLTQRAVSQGAKFPYDGYGYGSQGTLRARSVVLFLASASAGLRFAGSVTSLVLLQVVFMGWEIVLVISAW